jgi:hypothetical protein
MVRVKKEQKKAAKRYVHGELYYGERRHKLEKKNKKKQTRQQHE